MANRWITPWRASSFRLQALSLCVAAFSLMAMLLIRAPVDDQFFSQTAELNGGDWVLEGSRYPEATQLSFYQTLDHTSTISFSSVLVHEQQFLLVNIRAVGERYPLYGRIETQHKRFGEKRQYPHGPARGEIWLSAQGFDRLGLRVGDTVQVGHMTLVAAQLLVRAPDQQFGFQAMTPSAMMHLSDLDAAGVLAPGSRYRHRVLIRTEDTSPPSLEELANRLRPDQSLNSAAESEGLAQGPLQQLLLWVQVAVMLVLLLCAATLFLSARLRAQQQRTRCAVLRTVGASHRQVLGQLIGVDMQVLLPPLLLGLVLGGGLGYWVGQALQAIDSQSSPLWPIVKSGAIAFFAALALWFSAAAPALLTQLRRPPAQLLHAVDSAQPSHAVSLLGLMCVPLICAFALGQNFVESLQLVAASFAVAIILPLLFWPLFRLLDAISRFFPFTLRLALRRLVRRQSLTLPLLSSLIIALSVMSTSLHTGQDLISQWRTTLPTNAPNYFLLNVLSNDLATLREWQAGQTIDAQAPLYPIVRGRLTHVNDIPVREAVTKETRRGSQALQRDLSLTEANTLPQSNTLISGRQAVQPGEVTVESRLAEALELSIGDTLRFTLGSAPQEATITGLRAVNWNTLAPNFYFMFAEGSLPKEDMTWITSFYLPDAATPALSQLLNQLPHVSLLDVGHIVQSVQGVVDQASNAGIAMGALLFSASLLVLFAAVLSALPTLRKDNQLLSTLGASRALRRNVNTLQVALICVLAAGLANLLHLGIMWPLTERLLDGAAPLSLWYVLPWVVTASIVIASLVFSTKLNSHPIR